MKFQSCILALFLCHTLPLFAVDFNRDIRPLLASKCYACHGPDEGGRKAKLRLDLRGDALKKEVIVPGEIEDSEFHYRIRSDDPEEIMPPPESKATLTEKEKDLLDQWIAEGAKYDKHWAFVPPVSSEVPQTKSKWGRNPIDTFVLAKLEQKNLSPSKAADHYALVRRLYLDLIGLPPTPEQADAFVQDKRPDACDQLVDELLASPHYGEKWGREWLDLARYADTNGYEKDRPRNIWPYRDWVIRSLNADMPYDQFTIEQLAGDMLPNASQEQKIATGFHRNTQLNEEGGIDPLEFRFYAAVDRVATTGTVWMGLTTGCAQCHTHKYDPITHDEYYGLMALLDNVEEPDLFLETEQQAKQKVEVQKQIEAKTVALLKEIEGFEEAFQVWMKEASKNATHWTTIRPTAMKTNLPKLEVMKDGSIFSSGDVTKRDVFDLNFTSNHAISALRLEVLPDDRLPQRGPGRCYYEGRNGDFFLSEFTVRSKGFKHKINAPSHTYGKISIGGGSADAKNVTDRDGSSGWSTAGQTGKPNHLVLPLKKTIPANIPFSIEMLFERHFVVSLGRFRLSATSDAKQPKAKKHGTDIEAILTQDSNITVEELAHLRKVFLEQDPRWQKQRKPLEDLKRRIPRLGNTLVMQERPVDNPRPIYLRHRGEYISPKHQVSPSIPAVFAQDGPKDPVNRLELARWLVSERNPLGDRVTVNRAWRSFFGQGLIRTSGDFGTQASAPDHPELLDWLAVEFRRRGMSLKKLHRLIVTSSTYRQSSEMTEGLLELDPRNRLLARGPRFRLSGELIRDHMLAASGKLSSKMFGPGVYPPQPISVLAHAFGGKSWKVSIGEDRYRRSIYTFVKRTAPFAGYMTFDGTSGENCLARRDRSNTPLQALTLLNDEMFLELARAAGTEVHLQKKDPVLTLFRRFLTRAPNQEETKALQAYLDQQIERLTKGELKPGEIADDKKATPELAGKVLLARAIMNLDEAITKP
jgi:hypothetical protein